MSSSSVSESVSVSGSERTEKGFAEESVVRDMMRQDFIEGRRVFACVRPLIASSAALEVQKVI